MDRPWIYPWMIAYAIYALAILSTVQLAGAIYVLSTGIIDILCVWELTVGIVSVRNTKIVGCASSIADLLQSVLSFLFLGFQLSLARRYRKTCLRHTQRCNLSRACLTLLSLTMLLWLATSVIGWVVALRPKRSLRRQPLNSGLDNISDTKFQEAGFVGPLLAL